MPCLFSPPIMPATPAAAATTATIYPVSLAAPAVLALVDVPVSSAGSSVSVSSAGIPVPVVEASVSVGTVRVRVIISVAGSVAVIPNTRLYALKQSSSLSMNANQSRPTSRGHFSEHVCAASDTTGRSEEYQERADVRYLSYSSLPITVAGG
ncbi:hypothetical protein QC762_0002640 [Podospora pseudocomata]|uniref:Secreted protein n=1 Tax=Podospora pseudocomata TaxID=2093779 RepID=A0ABR0GT53_9PEZI|nr:hypothetical protein QC762_0002640 [Podospora pseudocomata]